MMEERIRGARDVVLFLKEQHEQIKMGFVQILTSSGDERQARFVALRRLLAVHETAEEEVVHPLARRHLHNGEIVVLARLQEENEAKKVLAELEDLDATSPLFQRQLTLLQTSVLVHAQAEESDEFERLGEVLDTEQLDRMRRAVEFAERVAPTRPHPGVESAAANMLVGPFASMLDRARDAISGKT
jgi:hemerythrin superfamily protein